MSFPIVMEAPEIIQFSEGSAERDARLLVAGDYPGKNLTVTEADIDALVANFSGPVPVKVEHIDSPLDPLGLVQRVWREGRQLMGRIAFPPEMAAFLSRRGAAKLSCGLVKGPAWRLLETSLTLTPHVPEATLLSEARQAELVTLRRTVRRQRVEQQLGALKAAGRVLPATEALAQALLSVDESAVVTLSEGGPEEAVSEVFLRFLEAQPPAVRFGEAAGVKHTDKHTDKHTELHGGGAYVGLEETEHPFTDDEREVMKRLGVEPGDVARTMRNDRMAAGRRQKAVE